MKALSITKFLIYKSPDDVNAEILGTNGEWEDYKSNGAKFLFWETSEEAEAFCRTLNNSNPTFNCKVSIQRCFINAWLHTGEQEMSMYHQSGLRKWDTDLLVYEGYDIHDTVWFISESKYHPDAVLAETGRYNVNGRQCYVIKDETIKDPLTQVMTATEADVLLGKAEGTVRVAINKGTFDEGIAKGWIRKSGATWLLTEEAIKQKYGINCFNKMKQNT